MTGSVIAAALLLYEHWKGKSISWGLCAAIAVSGVLVACFLSWVDEHDRLLNAQDALVAQKNSQDQRVRKAQLQHFLFAGDEIFYRHLSQNTSDADFQKYENDVNKWIDETATWIAANLGDKALARFVAKRDDVNFLDPASEPSPVNDRHTDILLALKRYRANLQLLIRNFPST